MDTPIRLFPNHTASQGAKLILLHTDGITQASQIPGNGNVSDSYLGGTRFKSHLGDG